MSRTLEIPDAVYSALERAANAAGVTPAAWIAVHLAQTRADQTTFSAEGNVPATLADILAGRIGRIASGGRACHSVNSGEQFTEYLEAKKKADHL